MAQTDPSSTEEHEPDPDVDRSHLGVREAGREAVGAFRRSLSTRLADLIRSDPEWAEQAADVGLVDRAWLEEPTESPFRSAPPTEIVQRFLERTSERRPSVLARLGLDALQVLPGAKRAGDDSLPAILTIMFTDLEDFTAFTAREGDESAAELIAEHQRHAGPIVRSRGGRVVKRLGDGLMMSFLAPEAALLAAVELVEHPVGPLRLRAGLHLGDAVVTHDDVYGNVVNVAARITEQAKGGQVLTSTELIDHVTRHSDLPGIEFGRARKVRLKGLDVMRLASVRSSDAGKR